MNRRLYNNRSFVETAIYRVFTSPKDVLQSLIELVLPMPNAPSNGATILLHP